MGNIQAFDLWSDFPSNSEKTWKFDFYLFCPNLSVQYIPVESNHIFITDDTRSFIPLSNRSFEAMSDSIVTDSLMHSYGINRLCYI